MRTSKSAQITPKQEAKPLMGQLILGLILLTSSGNGMAAPTIDAPALPTGSTFNSQGLAEPIYLNYPGMSEKSYVFERLLVGGPYFRHVESSGASEERGYFEPIYLNYKAPLFDTGPEVISAIVDRAKRRATAAGERNQIGAKYRTFNDHIFVPTYSDYRGF